MKEKKTNSNILYRNATKTKTGWMKKKKKKKEVFLADFDEMRVK